MSDLSPIQKKMWNYIRECVEEKGFPPTLRELGDAFDIVSTNGVRYHLRVLEKRGFLKHKKGTRRGIQLLNPDGTSPYKRTAEKSGSRQAKQTPDNVIPFPDSKLPPGLSEWWKPLPIVGRVAAGSPVLAEENREDEIGVDQALFGGGPGVELFGLRITGDSMSGIGIYDGDLAVVRKQRTAREGEVVVATVNDEATVKRYLPGEDRILLQSENPDYPSIVATDRDRFLIAGVVVGIIRRKIS